MLGLLGVASMADGMEIWEGQVTGCQGAPA